MGACLCIEDGDLEPNKLRAVVLSLLENPVKIKYLKQNSLSLAKEWQELFPDFIKPYVSLDVIGGEIGGAYKNVIAIASGICEGMGLGNNARASLVARGLVEMTRFGKYFGAQDSTFLGLLQW